MFLFLFLTASTSICLVHGGSTPELTIMLFRPDNGRVTKDLVWVDLLDDIILECHIEQLPPYSMVEWKFKSSLAITDRSLSVNYKSFDANKYKIAEGQRKNSYRLTVKSAEKKDSGSYECSVSYDENAPLLTESLTIDVGAKPMIRMSDSSTDTSAQHGENIELLCHASGIPQPSILWKRDAGLPLPNGGEYIDGSLLELENVQPSSRGVYICEARNKRGVAEMRILLSVFFKPIVKVDAPEVFQRVGYQKGLTCVLSANPRPSKSEVVWTTDGSIITDNRRFSITYNSASDNQVITSLMINGVRESDYGMYTCSASNNKGQGSAEILLSASDEAQADGKTGQILSQGNRLGISIVNMLAVGAVLVILSCN